MLRHKAGLLKTDFPARLGKVSYHVPCHLRVQNIGLKTRDVLKLVPETTVDVIERCSGHNGTYAVKKEFRPASMKIGRPVMTRVENARPDHYASDCPMAGHQIAVRHRRRPGAHASAEAAAHRLWHLSIAQTPWRSSSPSDLLSLEQYARERQAFRARVIEHKHHARSRSARTPTWCFEDRLTIQYQVQEMLRTERIFEPEASPTSSAPTTR